MKKLAICRGVFAAAFIWTLAVMPMAVLAQTGSPTPVRMPKNKYKVEDDVRLGREVSQKVNQQFPLMNDAVTDRYVESVGRRLVSNIPPEFRQPDFEYTFQVVNASDINAFALPGGPMYVNRGMIEAARNEGEMAGVMAHEISHVALRHATAQQTKVNSPLNQILGVGAIFGGAILGGQTGAGLGQLIVAGRFLSYSREYETQADILGAHIMADAGYDPRDLANMFQTISGQSSGGRAPEWLSSHPDPGNRYERINREARSLRIAMNPPIGVTREFQRTKERLLAMPKARSMAEIQRDPRPSRTNPTDSGVYSNTVPLPSARSKVYAAGSLLEMNIPSNWQEFEGDSGVTFAPEGAYGREGITHGAMVGIATINERNLYEASDRYVEQLLSSNAYLSREGTLRQYRFAGRAGYSIVLSGPSPVTNRTEQATVYTTQLSNGALFYVITISPRDQAYRYSTAFRSMLTSIRLTD